MIERDRGQGRGGGAATSGRATRARAARVARGRRARPRRARAARPPPGRGFSHAGLERRARRCHERKLAAAVAQVSETADWNAVAAGVLEACVAAVPYAPATAFLARERERVAGRDREPASRGARRRRPRRRPRRQQRRGPDPRARGAGLRGRGDRDRRERRPAAERGRRGRRPVLPRPDRRRPEPARGRRRPRRAAATACSTCAHRSRRRGRAAHRAGARPAGRRLLPHRAGGLRGAAQRRRPRRGRRCGWRSRPSTASATWSSRPRGPPTPGCTSSASPAGAWGAGTAASTRALLPRPPAAAHRGRIDVLYAGRLTREKGVDLLADSFLAARARDPRLHLLLAGGGPEEAALRARLGGSATFLGWLEGDELAAAYASADLFLFCSRTDTFGQVILEAQASGLPVVAVAAGGPAELVADGRSGVLCPAASTTSPTRSPARRLARGPRAAGARRARRRRRARLGREPRPRSPPAGSARFRSAQRPRPWPPRRRRDRSGTCARPPSLSPPRSSSLPCSPLDALTGDETVFVTQYLIGPLVAALVASTRATAASPRSRSRSAPSACRGRRAQRRKT